MNQRSPLLNIFVVDVDEAVRRALVMLLARLPPALALPPSRDEALAQWQQQTPPEQAVTVHVAQGTANKEIARLLDPPCSPRSVETHRAHLFAKPGLSNDNELGRWLLGHAWLHGHE